MCLEVCSLRTLVSVSWVLACQRSLRTVAKVFQSLERQPAQEWSLVAVPLVGTSGCLLGEQAPS